jgi:hypothetical protein
MRSMPSSHRYKTLPDEPELLVRSVPGVDEDVQFAHKRELRAAQNNIAANYIQRDRLMQAWALSNTLSREDMADATGLAKSRVDQLIRDITLQNIERRNAALSERTARHLP